jgi:hypothetical protein
MRNKDTPNTKKWDDMSTSEQARWLCLLEAVNTASKYAEGVGIDPEKSCKWIKPHAFNNYIKECFPAMKLRLDQEKQGVVFDD